MKTLPDENNGAVPEIDLTPLLNANTVNELLKGMQKSLNLTAIFIRYCSLKNSSLLATDTICCSDNLKPVKQQVIKLIEKNTDNGKDSGEFMLEGGNCLYRQSSLYIEKLLRGTVMYFRHVPLPDARILSLTSTSVFQTLIRIQDSSMIRSLQQNLRYQVVWAESMEWVKTVEHCNYKFFRDVMQRASLITESQCAAIYLVPEEGAVPTSYPIASTQWLLKNIESETLDVLVDSYQSQAFFDPDRSTSFYVDLKTSENASLQLMGSLLVKPICVMSGLRAVLFLFHPEGKPAFNILDETYLNQLLSQAVANIERHELVREVRKTNAALSDERQEQQVLIDQLKSAQEQLLQSEKMATIGQLAAGVAHEINNPIGYVSSNLTSLNNYVKDLLEALEKMEVTAGESSDKALPATFQQLIEDYDIPFLRDDLKDLMTESQEGIKRVKQIVQDLKDFSHVDDAEMQWADLHKGLESTLNIVHNELKYTCVVEKEFGKIPLVECVASQLNQVFMNLLVNAGHAIEKNGLITVKTWQEGENIIIQVADNGKGIEPQNISKLFEPFFTTKPVGKGTGLGLSLSYGIVQKHHGEIQVESEVGKGTTFKVVLPIQQPDKGEEVCHPQI